MKLKTRRIAGFRMCEGHHPGKWSTFYICNGERFFKSLASVRPEGFRYTAKIELLDADRFRGNNVRFEVRGAENDERALLQARREAEKWLRSAAKELGLKLVPRKTGSR